MKDVAKVEYMQEFLDNFAVDLCSLCGGLRLAAQNLPPPAQSCQKERDALNLLDLMIIGLGQLETSLEDTLSVLIKEAV